MKELRLWDLAKRLLYIHVRLIIANDSNWVQIRKKIKLEIILTNESNLFKIAKIRIYKLKV